MTRHLARLLSVAAAALAVPCAHAQVPADRIQRVADSLLASLHERGLFNGAVVLGRGDEEVYARGFGPANAAAGVSFTPDTPADGGSVTKTLTAAAILMLEDEGRLHLDDRVQQHRQPVGAGAVPARMAAPCLPPRSGSRAVGTSRGDDVTSGAAVRGMLAGAAGVAAMTLERNWSSGLPAVPTPTFPPTPWSGSSGGRSGPTTSAWG